MHYHAQQLVEATTAQKRPAQYVLMNQRAAAAIGHVSADASNFVVQLKMPPFGPLA
jgi:hypothetical protein